MRDFVKIISIPDKELFSETYVGCTASYLSELYNAPVGFVGPPHLRQLFALFAAAKGLLLLDIG